MHQVWSGTIDRLSVVAGQGQASAAYALAFTDGTRLPLNEYLGAGLTIEYQGTVVCRHCEREGRRSFGGGYCYDCFKTLARCDLCVVSPDRCHYDKGTCREPAWGESFCMQPHTVYLANSSGIKVGITRQGREESRWLDQGAIQGLPILDAISRRDAGLAEVVIATMLPDRTDWRRMLRPDVPELDMLAARQRLAGADLKLPDGVSWLPSKKVRRLHYPLPSLGFAPDLIKLDRAPARGNLVGMKGQYLVLSTGVLNVRQHAGYRITAKLGHPFEPLRDGSQQLGLF